VLADRRVERGSVGGNGVTQTSCPQDVRAHPSGSARLCTNDIFGQAAWPSGCEERQPQQERRRPPHNKHNRIQKSSRAGAVGPSQTCSTHVFSVCSVLLGTWNAGFLGRRHGLEPQCSASSPAVLEYEHRQSSWLYIIECKHEAKQHLNHHSSFHHNDRSRRALHASSSLDLYGQTVIRAPNSPSLRLRKIYQPSRPA